MPKHVKVEKELFFESKRFAVLTITAVCLLLYWQTTSFGFVWDDLRTHFVGNKDFRSGNLPGLWNKPFEGMYIPLSYSFWLFVYKATGGVKIPIPLYMHLTNVVFHICNCLLVFFLARKISKNNFSSLAGALFFAVHPVQAETVAWISEFRGLLSSFFMLTGMLLFSKWRSEQKFSSGKFSLILLFGLLAMLSKPSAIVYPLLLLLLDYFILKQFTTRNIYQYVLIALCLAPFAFFTTQLQPAVIEEMEYPLWLRFVLPFFCFSFYVFKILLPFGYSASYGFTPPALEHSYLLLSGAVLFFALLFFLCYKRRTSRPEFLFMFLFLMVASLPTSGIITFYFQQFSNVADRYLYIPMAGISIFVAIKLVEVMKLYNKKTVAVFMSVLLMVLSLINLPAQKKWKDDVALWEDTVKKDPDQVRVWHNLGVAYLDQRNDLDKGLVAINRALELNPDYDKALMNKGNVLARKGKLDEALMVFTRVTQLKPGNALAWYNRALTFYQLKKYSEAQNDFNMAEKLGHHVNEDFRKALIIANQKQNQ